MYQAPNQYALASKIMELTGIKEVSAYLTNPENLPPEQPDPAEEMQMQMAQKQLEKAKAENQHAIQSDNLALKEEQLKHKKLIAAAELLLAQQADEITAIASPNG
jgi:hypothetical protein